MPEGLDVELQQSVVSSPYALFYVSGGCESPEVQFLRSCPLSITRPAWVVKESLVSWSYVDPVSLQQDPLSVCSGSCLGCSRCHVNWSASSSTEQGF